MLGYAIDDDYERWADLEAELGKYLRQVSPDQIDEFLDSKAALEADLAEYLREQQGRVDVSQANIAEDLKKKLLGFQNEFSTRDKNAFLSWRNQVTVAIRYNFVSFNYTDALARIISEARKTKELLTHVANSSRYTDVIEDILHIHGTLAGGLILGLDNAMQIDNSDLQSNERITDYIVKATINDALGEEKTEKAKRVITESDYVCVYGMSFGDTDLMWWKYLLEWLQRKNSHKLVLYIYEEKTVNPSGAEKLRQENLWKDTFLNKAGAKDNMFSNLRKQIIVIFHSKIFGVEGVVKPQDTPEAPLAAVEKRLATV